MLRDLSKGKYQRTMVSQSSPQSKGDDEGQGTNPGGGGVLYKLLGGYVPLGL